ncbi:uncharacterized protein [Physcomitrium patens]|uniref:Uncharacterized protein n=2 Tax=Physcomitrium patens TaxID=3218 RepID=A0A2K1J764_PHYPA|nr:uncharacterized protein LOC112293871 [Physcomitrium patens]PNR37363.1 hypothetical protein PHYPA_020471 [Physcomitrium patens]|eukprot:XP_024399571.1 uncharacterized protein LOC112293871 [Physcomitrella patens]
MLVNTIWRTKGASKSYVHETCSRCAILPSSVINEPQAASRVYVQVELRLICSNTIGVALSCQGCDAINEQLMKRSNSWTESHASGSDPRITDRLSRPVIAKIVAHK